MTPAPPSTALFALTATAASLSATEERRRHHFDEITFDDGQLMAPEM